MGKSNTFLLVSAVVLMLATAIAISMAMWMGTLRLNAMVKTGEVNVDYENIVVEEFDEAEGKDVGNCTYTITTSDNADRLEIHISNGYPGYGCRIGFDIVNTGTIPVVGPFYNMTEIPSEIEVVFNPPSVQQLHPGDLAHYEIIIGVLQSANESSEYVVDIDITYIQWNGAYSSISGYVWNDTNENGIWDPGEDPVEGVTILLEQGNIVIVSTFTNSDGYYYFPVHPGTYIIKILLPTGYVNTTALTLTRTISAGESSINNNFGIMRPPLPPPPPPLPGLNIMGEFRETNTDFKKCPVKLGTPLDSIRAEVRKEGKVVSVSPGAFYHVLWISGTGLDNVNITVTYDYQFNIEDGFDGKIRVYMLNTTTMCVIQELGYGEYEYSVDNTLNTAIMNITLSNPLSSDAVVLIYIKFKPTDYDSDKEPHGLIGHIWDTLDKNFEVNYNIAANTGSATGTSIIQIVKK
ncbi:MAG: SdrD B-like domain-containing protein [Desulfurococcaceae archaeon]